MLSTAKIKLPIQSSITTDLQTMTGKIHTIQFNQLKIDISNMTN